MVIHKNFMTSQRNMNPYKGFLKHEHRHSERLFIRSKTDQVEISEEAHRKYDTRHIVELEKARSRKIASEYLHSVRELLGNDGDLRNVIRLEKITITKERISSGALSLEGEDTIGKTADSVIYFL